jgi:outer membrane protein assembly factor BamB
MVKELTSLPLGFYYLSSDRTDGKLMAFNAATGKRLWEIILGSATLYSSVVANGVLYTGLEGGKLFALNASTGKTLWSASVGEVASHPVVANGILYVGSYDNNLYAFHLSNTIQGIVLQGKVG